VPIHSPADYEHRRGDIVRAIIRSDGEASRAVRRLDQGDDIGFRGRGFMSLSQPAKGSGNPPKPHRQAQRRRFSGIS
jgi:hypothetical protein